MPPRRQHRSPQPDEGGGLQRLQKVLAAAGLGSRRQCEEYIVEGRVDVDGQTVTELGCKVDPTRQQIRVDGVVLPQPRRAYYLVNKPAGVVSTSRDPSGRPRVIDLIRSDERLFTVGRLDRSSEGLILVTNDGELANRLTHPRYGVEKVYRVRVAGQPTPQALATLQRGVYLSDGVARVSSIRVRRKYKQSSDLEIVLREGRNREVRRLLARVGHKVLRLTRIAIGPLRLGDLPPGGYRKLTRSEVRELQRAMPPAGRQAAAGKKKKRAADKVAAGRGGGGARAARPARPARPAKKTPGRAGRGKPVKKRRR